MRFFVFRDVLLTLEDLAALIAAVLVGWHGRLLLVACRPIIALVVVIARLKASHADSSLRQAPAALRP